MPNLRDFERRLGGLVEGLFSKTFRSGVQPVEIAKRVVRSMDDGKQVSMNEVWAPNHFEVSLSAEDAPRFQQIETALVTELSSVVRENAAERGWGLMGPPEVELFVDNALRKGDLAVEASLVQGEQPVAAPEPAVPEKRAQLRVLENGGRARDPRRPRAAHDRPARGLRGRRGRHRRLAAPCAGPHDRRRLHAHRSRLDERHEGQRARRADRAHWPTATTSRWARRRSNTGAPNAGRRRRALRAVGPEVRPVGAAVPVHLARDALGRTRVERRSQRAGRPGAAPPPPPGRPRAPASSSSTSTGRSRGRRPLDGSTTFGRGVECELRLDDTYVSQQHARIFDRGGNWYVEDLGSTNGTFVNEQKLVAPAMLTPGDKIRVGTTIVELRK